MSLRPTQKWYRWSWAARRHRKGGCGAHRRVRSHQQLRRGVARTET